MASLVDQFCPNVHDTSITAAAYDPHSGCVATADASGKVAVTRPGESAPGLVFTPGSEVRGALSLIRGGSLVAVGDESGSVGVFRTDNGQEVFAERREGARGRVRAMRGVAISPEGSTLASVAIDGLLRIWDLVRGERVVAWQGFGGNSVGFNDRGDRLVCLDDKGQPRMIDLRTREGLPMDRLTMPADHASFTPDGTTVVCAGPAGISLLRVADGVLIGSFATRGGSGISNICVSPDGAQVAAITGRSVHRFQLPELTPVGSDRHGAPKPSGAAFWVPAGIHVGGSDGLMHDGRDDAGVPPVTAASGFGDNRLVIHGDRVALWNPQGRAGFLGAPGAVSEALIDRDGRLIVTRGPDSPVVCWRARDGRRLFDGGADTLGAQQVAIGGSVVAALLQRGGLRWWDLNSNAGFDLGWPRALAVSGSGTWMGVTTPRGAVRILDPSTGRDALPAPTPLADVPVVRLAFVNRRPDLLVLDEDGVLGHYDLGQAMREGRPAEGRDVLDFNVEVDQLWGISGGRYCAIRLPEGERCTILYIDLQTNDVVKDHTDLHPHTWVDPETGLLLEPTRAGAVLERNMDGSERQVLRSLPGDEWISFGPRGILTASSGAGSSLR